MKITIHQDKLNKALSYASRAVSNRPNIPVLSNVLLAVQKEQLQLSSTNLDMGINVWIPGVAEEDGKLTVSGKFLTDFISAAGGDKVQLSEKADSLMVETETSKAQFQVIAASEFPVLPKPTGSPYAKFNVPDFIAALDKVIFACASDVTTSKIQFTGVLFEFDPKSKGKVTLVGLNGFRLSQVVTGVELASTQPDKSEKEEEQKIIIPAKPLAELSRILASEDSAQVEVFLSESKSQVIFKFDDIELSIRLLEGPYPDYKTAIPTEHLFSFEVDKGEFERALKVVNTFARSIFGNKVNWDLDLETGTLLMHTEVADLGKNETRIKVQNAVGSNDLKDAYSLQFLLEMVGHFKGDTIHFQTKAPLAPAVFTDPKDKGYLHLIMPLQRED